jgi:hypothetical protein
MACKIIADKEKLEFWKVLYFTLEMFITKIETYSFYAFCQR